MGIRGTDSLHSTGGSGEAERSQQQSSPKRGNLMQRAIRHLNNKFQKSSKSSDSKKSPEIFGDKVSNTALELDQGEYFFDPATGLLIDNSDYNAEPPNTKANYFKSLTQVATLGRDKLSDFGKRMTGKNKPTLDQDDQDFYKNLDMGVEEQIIRDKQIE